MTRSPQRSERAMTKYDEFIQRELASRLQPGEAIHVTGFIYDKSLGKAVLLGPLSLLGAGYYFAALTDGRLFLIATKMGLASIKMQNDGVTEIALRDIAAVRAGSSMTQRTISIALRNGTTLDYRLNQRAGIVSGQKLFADRLAAAVGDNAAPAAPVAARGDAPASVPSPAVLEPPTPAPPSSGSVVEQLKELASLRQAGVLTDEEYASSKAVLLTRL